MPRKPKKKVHRKKLKKDADSHRRSWISRLTSFVMTILALILITYVGLRMIVTTEGFRFYLSERLTERWDCPVSIASSRMDGSLNLELGGIEVGAVGDIESPAHISIQRVRLDVDYTAWLSRGRKALIRFMQVEDGQVEFIPDSEGVGQPQFIYSQWNEFLTFSGIQSSVGRETELVQNLSGYPGARWAEWCAVHVTDVSLIDKVTDPDHVLLFDRVEIAAAPLSIPGRNLNYMRFTALSGACQGAAFRNVEVEWISSIQTPFVMTSEIRWLSSLSSPAKAPPVPASPARSTPAGRETVQYYLEQKPAAVPEPPTRTEVQEELKQALQ